MMDDKLNSSRCIRRHRYTIIEVLASMGIFIILITALMQFFSSARTLWVSSSRRNELYANARVALDLISRDLQSAMYQNDNTTRGIYPFWYRERVALGYDNPQVNELNFIASTDLKPADALSKICEIRYTFVSVNGPALKDSEDKQIPEGWLVRSCVGDNDTKNRYNFVEHPFPTSDSGRMQDIWSNDDSYTPVIPGVVQLEIVCYSDVDHTFPAMVDDDLDEKKVSITDVYGVTNEYYLGQLGTMFPQVITIRIKLMDQENWKIYAKYRQRLEEIKDDGNIDGAEHMMDEIRKFLRRTLRTFSRTVYLSKRSSM
jgi:type II secretory pathway pseudopilin PulG